MIETLKQDNLVEPITYFFSKWFSKHKQTRLMLYVDMLLNPSVQNKIKFSDGEIRDFLSSSQSASEIDISPYEINRIFLHAITVSPFDWTPLFYQAFSTVFDFVNRGFNNNNNFTALALKKSSYPILLLDQLNYLKDRYEVIVNGNQETVARPTKMILLPHQVQTESEWFELLNLLSANKSLLQNIYRGKQVYFDNLLIKALNSNNAARILKSIPDPFVLNFIKKIPNGVLAKVITTSDSFYFILNIIPSQDCLAFCQTVGTDALQKYIADDHDLNSLLIKFPEENRAAFLQVLGSNKLIMLLGSPGKLYSILDGIPQENRIKLIQEIGNDVVIALFSGCCDWNVALTIFNMLPQENLPDFVQTLRRDVLRRISKNSNVNVAEFIRALPQEDRLSFLQALGSDTLKRCINGTSQLNGLLEIVPKSNLMAA